MARFEIGDYIKIRGEYLPKVGKSKLYIVKVVNTFPMGGYIEVTSDWLKGHKGTGSIMNDRWFVSYKNVSGRAYFTRNYIKEV